MLHSAHAHLGVTRSGKSLEWRATSIRQSHTVQSMSLQMLIPCERFVTTMMVANIRPVERVAYSTTPATFLDWSYVHGQVSAGI
jgi:hypothetical protein